MGWKRQDIGTYPRVGKWTNYLCGLMVIIKIHILSWKSKQIPLCTKILRGNLDHKWAIKKWIEVVGGRHPAGPSNAK